MFERIVAVPRQLLTTPTAQLGKLGRFAVFQIKLWSHCARLLRANRAGQQAAALAYHTIFGLVPLAIVLLLIFQLFPTHQDIANRIQYFTYEQLNLTYVEVPDPRVPGQIILLTDSINEIVGDFFKGVGTGSITIISVTIIIWAAIALLNTIERAFNNIWHVSRGRNLLHRIINYWALLTLAPLLIGVGVYISGRFAVADYLNRDIFAKTGPSRFLSTFAPLLSAYLIATIALFLLYFIMPNTKVKARAAISGALVAAVVWVAAKNAFGYYLSVSKFYQTVYGVLALIPLSVLAVYITWLIVLFGLQLTYTTQHLKSLDAAEIAAARKTHRPFIANDITVINILRLIAEAFERGKPPIKAETICTQLDLPPEFGDLILRHLVSAGLIVLTSEPANGYLPAKAPSAMRLADVLQIVASIALAQNAPDQPAIINRIAESQRAALADRTLQHVLDNPSPPGI